MNAPLIWILIPGLLAFILAFIRRWERVTILTGVGVCLALVLAAWRLPIGETITIGPLAFEISDTFEFLGRRFILSQGDQYYLIAIYLATAFWFGGSGAARAGRLFVPIGLAIAALLTASLAIEPFLYAALFIELVALACVPLLSPPGKGVGRGVMRFLTFQTLGMPFLLFAGWIFTQLENNPDLTDLQIRAVLFLGLGFSFLLAIFPFHTWLPMLAEEAHPYINGFVFFMLPSSVALFGLSFLEQYSWLRATPQVYSLLRGAGVLMVLIGGGWAIFQRHLGRILGYAVMVEIGMFLLSLGSAENILAQIAPGPANIPLFFSMFFARFLSLGVWALALSAIRSLVGDLHFSATKGIGRQIPFATVSLFLACLSLVGFPLTVGFPIHFALWNELVQISPAMTLASLLGCAGLLLAGIRSLAILLTGSEETPWQIKETRASLFFLVTGAAIVILAGIYMRL